MSRRKREEDDDRVESIRRESRMNLLTIVMKGSRSTWKVDVDDPNMECQLMAMDAYDVLKCCLYRSSGSPSCNTCNFGPPLQFASEVEREREANKNRMRFVSSGIVGLAHRAANVARRVVGMSKRGICINKCSDKEKTIVAMGLCGACYAKSPLKGTMRPRKNGSAKTIPVSGLEGYAPPKSAFTAASEGEIVMRIVVDRTDDLWMSIVDISAEEDRTVGQQIVYMLKGALGLDRKINIPSEHIGDEVRIRFKKGVTDNVYEELLEASRRERRELGQQMLYMLERQVVRNNARP